MTEQDKLIQHCLNELKDYVSKVKIYSCDTGPDHNCNYVQAKIKVKNIQTLCTALYDIVEFGFNYK